MTLELSYESFSDRGLASGDPAGRPARPSRHSWIDDRDVIYLDQTAAESAEGEYTFSLQTSRPGKGLRFLSADGRVLGAAGLGGPDSFTIAATDLAGGRLVFVKETPLGMPVEAYHLDTSTLHDRKVDTGYGGHKPVTGLAFYWARDSR